MKDSDPTCSGSCGGTGRSPGGYRQLRPLRAPPTPADTKITVSVTPNPVTEVGASVVNAVVQVEALAGYAGDTVNISSIDLTDTCASVDFETIAGGLPPTASNPISVVLDNEGNATVEVNGTNCAPGADVIEADFASVPYKTATTTLTVKGPANTPKGRMGQSDEGSRDRYLGRRRQLGRLRRVQRRDRVEQS